MAQDWAKLYKYMNKIKEKKQENICMKGHWKFTIRDAKTGKVKRVQEYENIIPTVGRTMIADNLTNASPDNAMRVNYVALGSDGTAVANSDTTLTAETYRNTVASETNSNNIAYITGFFNATEDDGTYLEAGLFSDGTASADTGILLSHVNINVTKSNTETLTIDWSLTIS
jgi:hypothetical protein